MISKKTFFSVLAIILVVFFLFQTTQVVRTSTTDDRTNPFAKETQERKPSAETEAKEKLDLDSVETEDADGCATIIYSGSREDRRFDAVRLFALTSGKTVKQYETLRKLYESEPLPEELSDGERRPMIVIAPDGIDFGKEKRYLLDILKNRAVSVVLCKMPSNDLVDYDEDFRRAVGIYDLHYESVFLTGIQLFNGLFAGGGKVYENNDENQRMLSTIDRTVPWYVLLGGSKCYIRGNVDTNRYTEVVLENIQTPPLMWRYAHGPSVIYTAYDNYLSADILPGALRTFSGEDDEFSFYPVINAQMTAFVDYPLLTEENTDTLSGIYGRSVKQLQRDVFWETINSMTERRQLVPSFFMAPELDYEDNKDPDPVLLAENINLIAEEDGEAVLSLDQVSDADIEDILKKGLSLFEREKPDYRISSVYAPDSDSASEFTSEKGFGSGIRNVFTAAGESESLFSLENGILRLPLLSDVYSYTILDDLAVRSMETAYGYNTIGFDLKNAFYPRDESDEWQTGYRQAFSNYDTYFRPFGQFTRTSATETAGRVRNYLSMDLSDVTIDYRQISIRRTADEPAEYFLFRSENYRLKETDAFEIRRINEGMYLVKADGDKDIVLEVEKDPELDLIFPDEDDPATFAVEEGVPQQ